MKNNEHHGAIIGWRYEYDYSCFPHMRIVEYVKMRF